MRALTVGRLCDWFGIAGRFSMNKGSKRDGVLRKEISSFRQSSGDPALIGL
jgi:hypothetical protein